MGGGVEKKNLNFQQCVFTKVSLVISYVQMESVSNVLALRTLDTNSSFMRLITCEKYKGVFSVVYHQEVEYPLEQCILSMTAVHIFMTDV